MDSQIIPCAQAKEKGILGNLSVSLGTANEMDMFENGVIDSSPSYDEAQCILVVS